MCPLQLQAYHTKGHAYPRRWLSKPFHVTVLPFHLICWGQHRMVNVHTAVDTAGQSDRTMDHWQMSAMPLISTPILKTTQVLSTTVLCCHFAV